MTTNAVPKSPNDDLKAHFLVTQFLGLEAMLLDQGQFEEWYQLLDDNFTIEVPTRVAAVSRKDELADGAFRIRDSRKMIRTRIDRLSTGIAYAESPPSRTLRSVSSICLVGDSTPGIIGASSCLVLYRHRGIDASGDYIHARRHDRFRVTGGGLRLVSRKALLTETILDTPNLGVFL